MKPLKAKYGFSLVEVVVMVGVLGVVMVTITVILTNSFKARNRIDVTGVVEQDATLVLRELRENVVVASSVGITCAITDSDIGSTISLVNVKDEAVTSLVCYEGEKIASVSASGTFDLTSPGVIVTGCDNFARCSLFPDSIDRINMVNFTFTLSSGSTGDGADTYQSRVFRSSVVPRN